MTVAVALGLQQGAPGPLEARAARPAGLPLVIAANRGQWEESVRYAARWAGGAVWFTDEGPVLSIAGRRAAVEFQGVTGPLRLEPGPQLASRIHFLHGGEPEAWVRDVPTYGEVLYRGIYPGVDLRYRVAPEGLKSEFLIAPGADPRQIRWRYSGARSISVDREGDLVVDLDGARVVEAKPEIYQQRAGRRTVIEGGYEVSNGTVCFRLGRWDPSLPLIVDPVLSFSTYLGGSGFDSLRAVALDPARNIYVAGFADSRDVPGANGWRNQNAGGVDAIVAKVGSSGNLIYLTYLGGSGDDRAFGVAVDSAGAAYVTGWTYSANFPTTTGARQRVLAGGRDAFVVKFNSAGNGLVYSTFLGGGSHDAGYGLRVDAVGVATVTGETWSLDFPVIRGTQLTNRGGCDAFVARLDASGGSLLWSTYLGGTRDDSARSVDVDSSGAAYVAGSTYSADFPVAAAVQTSLRGISDGFVTKVSSDGRSWHFSTYLGGGGEEAASGIRVDADGSVTVVGVTASPDFPVQAARQSAHGGGQTDAFVAKLPASGAPLVYSTYLGGASSDAATAVDLDAWGNAYVTGYTASPNFPLRNPLRATNAGVYDVFLTVLTSEGGSLPLSTLLGGSGSDAAYGVAVDARGEAHLVGQTQSPDWPAVAGIQGSNPGGVSGFLTRVGYPAPVAAWRDASGATLALLYGDTTRLNAGGVVADDVGLCQALNGDFYVAARNSLGNVWLNWYRSASRSWQGWINAGGTIVGSPALAVSPSGTVFVVVRSPSSSYWLNRFLPTGTFAGWVALGGTFASDPSVAATASDSLYIAGRGPDGRVWVGQYTSQGFLGWFTNGGLTNGKPAIVAGSDEAAYVAVRGTDNALWLARVVGTNWEAWQFGGGQLTSDPVAAAAAGMVYVAVSGSGDSVWVRPFREGSGSRWQPWQATGGTLTQFGLAAAGTRYFIVGKNAVHGLWWYQSGAGWAYYGTVAAGSGNLAAAPK
ncbi:MAG: SBBP repeat-containing protein [Bryobacteraceae bacterium]|nr:SBBP repeat-containing protein [Bryobacteraceae bacterium]